MTTLATTIKRGLLCSHIEFNILGARNIEVLYIFDAEIITNFPEELGALFTHFGHHAVLFVIDPQSKLIGHDFFVGKERNREVKTDEIVTDFMVEHKIFRPSRLVIDIDVIGLADKTSLYVGSKVPAVFIVRRFVYKRYRGGPERMGRLLIGEGEGGQE